MADPAFNNLPAQLTPLVGREQEITAICALLRRADTHLITLTGTGGIGKTRLSLAVAGEVIDLFADGVCFVSLAAINDPPLVIYTIAHLLGLDWQPIRQAAPPEYMNIVKAFLRNRHFLLVLDNFEQVVPAAPSLVELLMACPHLKIVVTSRAALHARGEREFPVPPLALPRRAQLPPAGEIEQYAAVSLFAQRASAVKSQFILTSANAPAVAAICLHLDGLPLAIELAAARIKLLSPQALLQRLTHRLAVLTGGMQDAPVRQQTLRNTIEWSYNLLAVAEQRLFRRLAVFVGSFTLEAVEAVSAAFDEGAEQALEGVASLIDKSLLQQTELEGDEPRFVMLETIREFALERLASGGEMEQTRRAHADYYLRLIEDAETCLYGAEQGQWFDRLEREHDNLRAVLNWSMEREGIGQRREMALHVAGALVRFWLVRGYASEGRAWLEQALANSEGIVPAVRANALCGAGWLAFLQNDIEQAKVLCEEGLRCYREARKTHNAAVMASSLIGLGWLAVGSDNDSTIRFLLDESRALARDAGDTRSLAHLLNFLGAAAIQQGNFTEARSLLEEGLALFKEMDNRFDMAWTLRFLGLLLFSLRDKARAYALVEESRVLSREMHDIPGLANSLYLLGRFALDEDAAATARALLEESLDLYRVFGDQQDIAYILSQLACAATVQGDEAAAHLWYKESLALFQQINDRAGLAFGLQGWGALVARQGDGIWAARLWGAAETLRESCSLRTPFLLFVRHTDYEQADYERMVNTVRAQLGENAFATAWAEGRAMTPEQALENQRPQTTLVPIVPLPPTSHTTVRAPAYPAELTAREIQVLRLLAGGLTNAEIAGELGLSGKTIAHHLTTIFKKTGSENRAAAVAFAIRHGLA